LRLSQKSLEETTAGKVINLISNDVSRFDIAMNQMHYTWIGPLTTIVVTYFLWQEIGASSLIGVSPFLFFIPLQCTLKTCRNNYTLYSLANYLFYFQIGWGKKYPKLD